jgi:hypothetical protein
MTGEPVACSLSAAALDERRARWQALGERALVEAGQRVDGARQVYRADAGVEQELRELVALEAECCPFLEFEVSVGDGRVVLDVRGPEAAASLVESFVMPPPRARSW